MEVRNLRGRYSPEFILSTEDRGNYGISWSPFDAYSCKAASSPWTYNTAWDSEHQKTAALFYHGKTCILFKDPLQHQVLLTYTEQQWCVRLTLAFVLDI
jgi:hypothetical protein